MKRVMVRYRVKAERVDENASYIEKVFRQLRKDRPAGLRYASFRLDDGVTFVHLADVDTADGNNPLTTTEAFKAFQAGLKDRCEELPVVAELHEVGSFDGLTTGRGA